MSSQSSGQDRSSPSAGRREERAASLSAGIFDSFSTSSKNRRSFIRRSNSGVVSPSFVLPRSRQSVEQPSASDIRTILSAGIGEFLLRWVVRYDGEQPILSASFWMGYPLNRATEYTRVQNPFSISSLRKGLIPELSKQHCKQSTMPYFQQGFACIFAIISYIKLVKSSNSTK